MTATPNLPPLPEPMHRGLYGNSQMRDYALAAYQASRNTGLEEAVMLIETASEEAGREHMRPGLVATLLDCAGDVYALRTSEGL